MVTNVLVRPIRLRTGLAVQLLTLLAGALLLFSWFVVRQTRSELVGQVDKQLAGALAARARDGQRPPPDKTNRPPSTELPSTGTFVYSPAGRELSFVASGANGKPDARPQIDGPLISTKVGVVQTVSSADESVRFRAISTRLTNGNIVVEVAPLRRVDAAVAQIIRTLVIGSLLMLGLAGLALYLLVRKALAPLALIAKSASVVATGNVSYGVGVTSRYSELNGLSEALTSMVSQLGTAYDSQTHALALEAETNKRLRQFVSDASHELQTPVTSIRGWAELHRKGGLVDTGSRERAFISIEREATRMGRLIDDLLALTRADEQQVSSRLQVNVGLVCVDAIETARSIDNQRTIAWVVDPDTDLTLCDVVGDPNELRRVVDNILANARVHTPKGTVICVRIKSEINQVMVEVADNGPGIAPDQIHRVFDRFWQADHSRSDSHGLGLAIVQAIVDKHGGTVRASNRIEQSGAVITLTLPLAMTLSW